MVAAGLRVLAMRRHLQMLSLTRMEMMIMKFDFDLMAGVARWAIDYCTES